VHEDAVRFLSQPVEAQPGSPLRVAVYSRIAEAIRNNLLQPGSMLPTETELGTDMKVSRTVVREALMLLEEDGLIRARRGVGRFVSDTLPRIGIERIRPFEEVLGGPGHQEIKRIQVERQPASEFVAPGVASNPAARSGSGSPS
jgi:GntR family transcriptional regulator